MFTVYLRTGSCRESSDVPARPTEASNKSGRNWVTSIRHNDGDCLGRLFDGTDRWISSGGNDDINLETNQLGRQTGKPIQLALSGSPLNGHILSFNVAEITEPLPKCFSADRDSGQGS